MPAGSCYFLNGDANATAHCGLAGKIQRRQHPRWFLPGKRICCVSWYGGDHSYFLSGTEVEMSLATTLVTLTVLGVIALGIYLDRKEKRP